MHSSSSFNQSFNTLIRTMWVCRDYGSYVRPAWLTNKQVDVVNDLHAVRHVGTHGSCVRARGIEGKYTEDWNGRTSRASLHTFEQFIQSIILCINTDMIRPNRRINHQLVHPFTHQLTTQKRSGRTSRASLHAFEWSGVRSY